MSERSRRQEIGAVRKRRAEHRGKIAIVDGKLLRQIVIERNLLLVVKGHGLVVSGSFHAVVELIGLVIDENEPIHQRLKQRVIRMIEIRLAMRVGPSVVKVGNHAAPGIVKREDGASIVVTIGVLADEVSASINTAGQAV